MSKRKKIQIMEDIILHRKRKTEQHEHLLARGLETRAPTGPGPGGGTGGEAPRKLLGIRKHRTSFLNRN
jgi:hypothetical protein